MRAPYRPEAPRPAPGAVTLGATALFVTAFLASVVPPAALAGAFLAASAAVAVYRFGGQAWPETDVCVPRTDVCV